LQERPPHIVFTRKSALVQTDVGDETNPYSIAQKIFTGSTRTFLASAREYSTFSNISEYVLQNRHGDCGMQTLFFITLCVLTYPDALAVDGLSNPATTRCTTG
jgi:hypothetical protein